MTAQVLRATPSLDSGGNVMWSLCDMVKNQCGGKDHYPKIDLPYGSGSTPFTITINDVNHLGVQFDGDPNAMWIQPGTQAPTAYVFDSNGQIPNYHRAANDVIIQFTDANNEHGSLSLAYTLNFVRNGQAVTSIDPIINNGGCCPGTRGGLNNTSILLLGAALLAVLFLVVYFGYRSAEKRPASGVQPGPDEQQDRGINE